MDNETIEMAFTENGYDMDDCYSQGNTEFQCMQDNPEDYD